MGYKTIRFDRKQLYEQVWTKPMRELAQEYGLSDVGLRKICKSLNIPLPPQGYHLRKYKSPKPPLPPPKGGVTEHVTHIHEPEPVSAMDVPQPVEIQEIAFEENPENRISVAGQLGSAHPLITEAKVQLKKATPDKYGRVSTYWKRGCDISVFPVSVDRALRIWNALFKAMDKRGFRVSLDTQNHITQVKVLDELIGIRLEERSRQARHVPTPAELNEEKRLSYRTYPAFDYFSTGEFSLVIPGSYGNEKICKDDKRGKIEEKLNDFVIALIKRALQMKDQRARRQREEQARQERERRRWELDALIRKETERVEVLKKQADAWHESQKLRAFIHAAREKCPIINPESKFAKWLVWASLQADRLDPLKNSPPSILDEERPHW
jgi:hypothetical protein